MVVTSRIQYPIELIALACSFSYPYEATIDGAKAKREACADKQPRIVTRCPMTLQFVSCGFENN